MEDLAVTQTTSPYALAWGAILTYIAITIALTVRGVLKTKDVASYSVGNRDIPPIFVGISLSAQMTSVATFVVNPGLIYAYGLAGFLGLGVAAGSGIVIGLFLFSRPFFAMGTKISALTVPQWIGKRYQSTFLQVLFAFISLGLAAFAVLIVVALAQAVGPVLGIPAFDATGVYNVSFTWLIIFIVGFVFSYMMLGGVNTHAYTTLIQGIVMLIVGLILIFSGLPLLWSGGLLQSLREMDPNLVSLTNPASLYFRNLFEVFVCNFLVGLSIVLQPHIIGKVLYLKEERQIWPYLATAVVAGTVFLSVMLVGLYARVALPETARWDTVVPTYIAQTFSPGLMVFITLGLICAGLSTLEGILLSLSTIFSMDIFLPLLSSHDDDAAQKAVKARKALRYGQVVLAVFAIVIIYLSVGQVQDPTGGSVAIFGQYGVYLVFTTSLFPLAAGMFLPNVKVSSITIGVFVAIITYVVIAVAQLTYMHNNPGFLATMAIILGWLSIAIHHQVASSAEGATDGEQPA